MILDTTTSFELQFVYGYGPVNKYKCSVLCKIIFIFIFLINCSITFNNSFIIWKKFQTASYVWRVTSHFRTEISLSMKEDLIVRLTFTHSEDRFVQVKAHLDRLLDPQYWAQCWTRVSCFDLKWNVCMQFQNKTFWFNIEVCAKRPYLKNHP